MPNQVKSLNRSVSKQTARKSDDNALLKGEVNNFSRYPLGGIFLSCSNEFLPCVRPCLSLPFCSLKNFGKKKIRIFTANLSCIELEEFICVWARPSTFFKLLVNVCARFRSHQLIIELLPTIMDDGQRQKSAIFCASFFCACVVCDRNN